MATVLDQAIRDIYNTGFFDYALPFMITFAIIYGITNKTMLLGKQNKKLNSVFALLVSLMILPFVSKIDYITYASKLVFIVVKFTMLMIILGLLGYRFENKRYAFVFGLLGTLVIVATEFFDIASFKNFINFDTNTIYIVVMVLAFALVLWIITGKSSTKGERKVMGKEPKGTKEEIKKEKEEERKPKREEVPEYGYEKVGRIPGSELEKPGYKFRNN